MKIAVIGGAARTWEAPLTRSLVSQLRQAGADAEVFGWKRLLMVPEDATGLRSGLKKRLLSAAFSRLRRFDGIVIIETLPNAFERSLDIEALRRACPESPVILCGNMFLPSRPHVVDSLRSRGQKGFNRYDWYLSTSLAGRHAVPEGANPVSRIGVELDGNLLRPGGQRDFEVLFDFPRPGKEHFREVQIQTMEEMKIPYRCLTGRMSYSEIAASYRRASVFFLSFGESFGLPICEVQASGCGVAAPSASWCASHLLKDDIHRDGLGEVWENLIVYDDKDDLKRKIGGFRDQYDPWEVRSNFGNRFPHYLHGDVAETRDFVSRLSDGRITPESHRSYTFSGFPEEPEKPTTKPAGT